MLETQTIRSCLAPLLLLSACLWSGCATRITAPAPEMPAERASADTRLVVLVVVDQLAAWVLEEHLSLLPAESVMRQAWTAGRRPIIHFPYANTATAAGHATLVTGVLPSEHGVLANEVWDHAIGRRKIVDDREHSVIGNPERYVSPAVLRVATVADRLHEATGGRAVIAGLSHKARAATISTGRATDLAIFWDEDGARMTTSTWYRPDATLPPWLDAFNRAHPLAGIFGDWEPPLASLPCEDDAPGEGPFLGWDGTLPHRSAESKEPGKSFTYTPYATTHLFDLARVVVDEYDMGRDSVPDLLVLGVSTTDKIGHVWGPRSCEYIDNLLRLDQELTAFSNELMRRVPAHFLLTADHGVAPLPEEATVGGRIDEDELLEAVRNRAAAALGAGEWIAGYTASMLWLTPAGDARRAELIPALREALLKVEGVDRAYDVRSAAGLHDSEDEIDRLVAASLPDDTDADLFIVPRQNWFNELSDVPGGGVSHGTPWQHDREVPILAWGPDGPRPDITALASDARHVAALLTRELGISTLANALPPASKPADGPLTESH